MLLINKHQFTELERRSRDDFLRRMAFHFRAMYPDIYHSLPLNHLGEALERCVARAQSHGLSDEFSIMRFVDYLTMLGWTFDTNEDYAWVVRILHDSERSELQRIADIDMILFGGPLENPLNG